MSVLINASTSTGLVQSADTSGEIELQSNGTTALKVNTNEGIQILNCLGVGNAIPSTSGAGITFPATQSASTDANTLDDYEEGTFTVAFTPATGSMTMDTNRDTYQYVKIGRMVHIQGYARPSTVSSPTGVVTFTLPFTATAGTEFSAYSYGVAIGENLVSGVGNGFSVLAETSSATASIRYTAGGTSAANWEAVGQKFQANTNMVINLVYQTA
jgi:hypothetical protein